MSRERVFLAVFFLPQNRYLVMLPNEVFALGCRAWYEEQGLIVDETNGEFAHSPLTRKECDTGYYLLWEHHQHQGLLQSKDLNKCCFFPGHTHKWLKECDYFPENYFELCDIYEKYARVLGLEATRKAHREKDEKGKSLHTLEINKQQHAEKDELGRSVFAVKIQASSYQGEKDERGVPLARIRNGERLHSKKDEFGRSVAAMTTNNQVWESTKDGFKSSAAGVVSHNKANGWDTNARKRIS